MTEQKLAKRVIIRELIEKEKEAYDNYMAIKRDLEITKGEIISEMTIGEILDVSSLMEEGQEKEDFLRDFEDNLTDSEKSGLSSFYRDSRTIVPFIEYFSLMCSINGTRNKRIEMRKCEEAQPLDKEKEK